MAVTREELLKFLSKKTRANLSEISNDTPLFSTGTVDSFAMVDLMMWLEKKTGVRADPSAISIDTFDTIDHILAYSAKGKR